MPGSSTEKNTHIRRGTEYMNMQSSKWCSSTITSVHHSFGYFFCALSASDLRYLFKHVVSSKASQIYNLAIRCHGKFITERWMIYHMVIVGGAEQAEGFPGATSVCRQNDMTIRFGHAVTSYAEPTALAEAVSACQCLRSPNISALRSREATTMKPMHHNQRVIPASSQLWVRTAMKNE